MALGFAGLVPVFERLGPRAADGVQILPAAILVQQHYPQLDPDGPVLLVGPLTQAECAVLARLLQMVYPEDHPLAWVTATEERQLACANWLLAASWRMARRFPAAIGQARCLHGAARGGGSFAGAGRLSLGPRAHLGQAPGVCA